MPLAPHQQAELFIVTLQDFDHREAPEEYLDAQGDATPHITAAHLYWDVTEALCHASIAQAQGLEADAQQIFVTLH